MFKRFFAVLLFMPFAILGFAAQLTATLQSGDKVSPFYGTNAFVDAYNAAVDGDVITLSSGSFNTTEIKKGVTIIGTYAFSKDTSKSTYIGNTFITADNVKVEGIRFGGNVTINGADNLTINRSYVSTLLDTENGANKYHDKTIITDCLIDNCQAMSLSQNAVFRNCCINQFSDTNESSYPALIENCNIPVFAYYDNVPYEAYKQPYAIYRNCFLGLYKTKYSNKEPTLSLNSPSEFHNVIFHSNYEDAKGSSCNKAWIISYNSCIKDNVITGSVNYYIGDVKNSRNYSSFASYTYSGLTVGPKDRKEYPAIPEITSAEIDTETDAEGNIHVKISATARD